MSAVLAEMARWCRSSWKRVAERAKGWTRIRTDTARTPSDPKAAAPRRELQWIEHAHREWLSARMLFDHVTDPELVEQAIHRMTAAEKRYVYLWKLARQTGLASKFPPPSSYR